jgi:hypothetical protein
MRRLRTALRVRGFRRTAQSIGDLAEDALFDLRYGIRTIETSVLDRLSITSANRQKGLSYEPIRVRHLRRLLGRIPLESRTAFVDFGSGRGRSLFVAHLCGFRAAVGVEFAAELCEQADENLRKFEASIGKKSGVSTVHMDAVDFEVESEHTVFYFNNPFAADVLAEVLRTIQKSLRDAPRTAWVLYSNPAHRDLVEGMPGFAEEWRETWGSTESIVYRFDPTRQ